MNKTNIDWGYSNLYTWNPITGCKRGCDYCYARNIHNRFNKTSSFSSVIEHPDRFTDPGLSCKKPRTIFVGSMTDIEYWTKEQLQRVVDLCRVHSQHTLMFLSKYYDSFSKIKNWPENTMQGLTITGNGILDVTNICRIQDFPRPFLSIEPLLGRIPNLDNVFAHSSYNNFELIIVGAMTGPGAIIPKQEWIQSITDNCPEDKVYWKQSIKPYL